MRVAKQFPKQAEPDWGVLRHMTHGERCCWSGSVGFPDGSKPLIYYGKQPEEFTLLVDIEGISVYSEHRIEQWWMIEFSELFPPQNASIGFILGTAVASALEEWKARTLSTACKQLGLKPGH